jgi:hypothetical protein
LIAAIMGAYVRGLGLPRPNACNYKELTPLLLSQVDSTRGDESPPLSPQVRKAIEDLATKGGLEARGAIFTRPEVVEFILDLVGYNPTRPLHKMRLLEPSFGGGDFLLPIIGRLLDAWRSSEDATTPALKALEHAICAVELHRETFEATYSAVVEFLKREGLPSSTATALADRWLSQGDFLLTPLDGAFDFAIGNPPYVRQELIPSPLLNEYRSRYSTMYDRADLYIPFIERSLTSLKNGGKLGFICADRWMKNRYGGPLRQLVSDKFHLQLYVDMVGTPAFHSEVSAYPAITVIARESSGPTRIAHRPTVEKSGLAKLAKLLKARTLPANEHVREIARVPDGAEPWLLESIDQTNLIRRLEQQFPTIEEAGCKVGIGVATGADKAFIGNFDALDVEPDRKVRLVTTKDIMTGEVEWRGQGVINPFADEGGLVPLKDYPRLRRYLEARRDMIAARHCAQKAPASWYRTIDRITPSLASKPKLLIPDIKGEAHIVYENGTLYPHHNLYYVTSEEWELRALQAVLLSEISRLFVATYSTKMRGGFLRFQAQYLRRIRIPRWVDVPKSLRKELTAAAKKRDLEACNNAAFKLYGLSKEERSALGGNGD